MKRNEQCGMTRMSRFAEGGKATESLDLLGGRGGQSDPRHCPQLDTLEFPLGDAMEIEEVAVLLGCSAWTVRQKYVRQGLPFLRTSASGKFVFFRRQVLDWILERQRKEEWK